MLLLKSLASVDRSIVPHPEEGSYLSAQARLYFHCASGFCTQILAYMLDSLVRVSRRVNENHFVSIANTQYLTDQYQAVDQQNFVLQAYGPAETKGRKRVMIPQPSPRYDPRSISRRLPPCKAFSPEPMMLTT